MQRAKEEKIPSPRVLDHRKQKENDCLYQFTPGSKKPEPHNRPDQGTPVQVVDPTRIRMASGRNNPLDVLNYDGKNSHEQGSLNNR